MPDPIHSLPEQTILQQLFPLGKILRITPLKGGISAQMSTVEIALPGGQLRRVVLRKPDSSAVALDPQILAREFNILQFAFLRGLPVPEPLLLDSSMPVMVMEYIDGKMDFSPSDRSIYLRRMAEQLAAIHRLELAGWVPPYVLPSAGGFEEEYGSSLFCGDPEVHEADLRAVLRSVWPLAQRNSSALVHGDYWPGNLLWRSGRIAAVVDWEDAGVGDPISDLAGCRMETNWIFGREFSEQFTEEYLRLNPLNTSMLPWYDLLAALRMLRWAALDFPAAAAFFHSYGRTDITENSVRTDIRNFIVSALKKIPG